MRKSTPSLMGKVVLMLLFVIAVVIRLSSDATVEYLSPVMNCMETLFLRISTYSSKRSYTLCAVHHNSTTGN